MSKLIKNKYTLPVVVFLVGSASLLAFGMKYRHPLGTGRTIHSKLTFVAKDGSTRLLSDETKYVRSDGTWKSVQTLYNTDGTVDQTDTQVGLPDRAAAYRVDDARKLLVMTGPIFHRSHNFTMDQIIKANSDNFVRVDQVLGYPVAVVHIAGEDAEHYEEMWISPDLGETIKFLKATPLGVNINEADSITLGEPQADRFTVPTYPDYLDHAKRRAQQMEDRGEKEQTAAWRQVIAAHENKATP